MSASIPPDESGTHDSGGNSSAGHQPSAVSLPVWRPGLGEQSDRVVTEEPLEIRLEGVPLAVTLRTPGADEQLAAGFLISEGAVRGPDAISSIVAVDDGPPPSHGNTVDVRLVDGEEPVPSRVSRPSLVNSACGLCGKTTLEAVRRRAPVLEDGPVVPAELVSRLPAALREAQNLFDETGGLHAAGLFDAEGRLLVAHEDVGRHNAVDKVIGQAALAGDLPLCGHLLAVSGRMGFEIAQKAWMVGIPLVASVSAPSHLAVDLAREAGMTLVGFVRNGTFNVYTGRERILPPG
jgi:FdhD protein